MLFRSILAFSTGTTPDTADTWTRHDAAPSETNPTHQDTIEIVATKDSAPGNVSYNPKVFYRYIIT